MPEAAASVRALDWGNLSSLDKLVAVVLPPFQLAPGFDPIKDPAKFRPL